MKAIVINEKEITLNVLLLKHRIYLPLIQSVFTDSSLVENAINTPNEATITKLFNAIYRVQNPSAIARRNSSDNQNSNLEIDEKVLDSLDIILSKKNPSISRITFKQSGNSYRVRNSDLHKITTSNTNAILAEISRNSKYLPSKSDIKLGVEIEFIGSSNAAAFCDAMEALVGNDKYYYSGRYNKNKGEQWVLGKDGSVKPSSDQQNRGMRGYELTSRILNLGCEDDITELKNVLHLVKTLLNGEVNCSCGTHIHMSCFDPYSSERKSCIQHLINLYSNSEESLFDTLVTKRRRGNNNRYCKSVSTSYDTAINERYHKLNVSLCKNPMSDLHIEFRQLQGTLDFDTIISWVDVQYAYLRIALSNWQDQLSNRKCFINKISLNEIIKSNLLNRSNIETVMCMSNITHAV